MSLAISHLHYKDSKDKGADTKWDGLEGGSELLSWVKWSSLPELGSTAAAELAEPHT